MCVCGGVLKVVCVARGMVVGGQVGGEDCNARGSSQVCGKWCVYVGRQKKWGGWP